MATKTWYINNTTSSGTNDVLTETQPGSSANTTTIVTVGKNAAGQRHLIVLNTTVSRTDGGWGTTAYPTAYTNSAAFRSPAALSGNFANTAWTIYVPWRCTTAASQSIYTRLRVYKGTAADGSNASELTTSVLTSAATGAMSTGTTYRPSISWSPGLVSLSNEYLFFVVAMEVAVAGTSVSANALIQRETQAFLTTPDWAPSTQYSKTASADAVIQATVTKTATADAVIGATIPKTATADAVITEVDPTQIYRDFGSSYPVVGSGTGTSYQSSSFTTTATNAVIIVCVSAGNSSSTSNAGLSVAWTSGTPAGATALQAAEQGNSGASHYNSSFAQGIWYATTTQALSSVSVTVTGLASSGSQSVLVTIDALIVPTFYIGATDNSTYFGSGFTLVRSYDARPGDWIYLAAVGQDLGTFPANNYNTATTTLAYLGSSSGPGHQHYRGIATVDSSSNYVGGNSSTGSTNPDWTFGGVVVRAHRGGRASAGAVIAVRTSKTASADAVIAENFSKTASADAYIAEPGITRDGGALYPLVGYASNASGIGAIDLGGITTQGPNRLVVVTISTGDSSSANIALGTLFWQGGNPSGASNFTRQVYTNASTGEVSIWTATLSSAITNKAVEFDFANATSTDNCVAIGVDVLLDATATTNSATTAFDGNTKNYWVQVQNITLGSWVYVAAWTLATSGFTPYGNTEEYLDYGGSTGSSMFGVDTQGSAGNHDVGWNLTNDWGGVAALEIKYGSSTTQTKTATAGAVIQAGQSKTASADAIVQAGQTKTASADAVVILRSTPTASADAVVQVRQTSTAQADAIVLAQQVSTAQADAIVLAQQSKTASADAVIGAGQTATATADAVINVPPTSVTASADAVIVEGIYRDTAGAAYPIITTGTGVTSVTTAAFSTSVASTRIVITVSTANAVSSQGSPTLSWVGGTPAGATAITYVTLCNSANGQILTGIWEARCTQTISNKQIQVSGLVNDTTQTVSVVVDALVNTGGASAYYETLAGADGTGQVLVDSGAIRVPYGSWAYAPVAGQTWDAWPPTVNVSNAAYRPRELVGTVLGSDSTQGAFAFIDSSAPADQSTTGYQTRYDKVAAPAYTRKWRTIVAIVPYRQAAPKTASANAVIAAVQTKTASAGAVIILQPAPTAYADAVVQGTQTSTATADAVINDAASQQQTKTATADAIVQAGQTLTAQADAVVQAGQTATASADASILLRATPTAQADGVVALQSSPTAQAGAVIQAGQSATAQATAVVQAGQTATASADAVISETASYSKTASADAVIRGTQTQTAAADASILLRATATAAADATVALRSSPTASADALIIYQPKTTAAADATVALRSSPTAAADAVIKAIQSLTATADAIVQLTSTPTAQAGAVVALRSTPTASADAVIKAIQLATAVADALITGTLSKTATADAVVTAPTSKTATADASILLRPEKTATAGAVIQAAIARGATADAIVKVIQTKTTSADAVIVVLQGQQAEATAVIAVHYTTTATANAIIDYADNPPLANGETPILTVASVAPGMAVKTEKMTLRVIQAIVFYR